MDESTIKGKAARLSKQAAIVSSSFANPTSKRDLRPIWERGQKPKDLQPVKSVIDRGRDAMAAKKATGA